MGPTAFGPTAQRCGKVATLGYESNESNNRNAVVANVARDGRTGMAATALRLEMLVGRWLLRVVIFDHKFHFESQFSNFSKSLRCFFV